MRLKERFIHKLAKLTEDDQIAWKAQEGKYTSAESYSTEYLGVNYVLVMRPEHSRYLYIKFGDSPIMFKDGIEQLVKAVLYKEHVPWDLQEHIKEVLGEKEDDGIE